MKVVSRVGSKGKKAVVRGKDVATFTPNIKVLAKEATNNEKWGPSGEQKAVLAQATSRTEDLGVIMSVLWSRLNSHGKEWRRIYKALVVIEYLLKCGSKEVLRDVKAHKANIKTLQTFQLIDKKNQDVGLSVREKSRQILELLNNPDMLAEERTKSRNARRRFASDRSGITSEMSASMDEIPKGSSGGALGVPSASPGTKARRARSRTTGPTRKGSGTRDTLGPPASNSEHRRNKSWDFKEDIVPETEPLPDWLSSDVTPSKDKKKTSKDLELPPDANEKAKKLQEMVSCTSDAALSALKQCKYSVSDAALLLSTPRTRSPPPEPSPSVDLPVDLLDLSFSTSAGTGPTPRGSVNGNPSILSPVGDGAATHHRGASPRAGGSTPFLLGAPAGGATVAADPFAYDRTIGGTAIPPTICTTVSDPFSASTIGAPFGNQTSAPPSAAATVGATSSFPFSTAAAAASAPPQHSGVPNTSASYPSLPNAWSPSMSAATAPPASSASSVPPASFTGGGASTLMSAPPPQASTTGASNPFAELLPSSFVRREEPATAPAPERVPIEKQQEINKGREATMSFLFG